MDGDLKHNTSSAKHDGGSALALARIAVSHTGLLVLFMMWLQTEVGGCILSSLGLLSLQTELSAAELKGQHFTVAEG